ncbi:MAG TPA: hypothetical protein VGQ35_06200 [Dongiaceae bacterium]|jgi:hypothetical protein|nr:hypothetical protein [Dongiaceae bacterium]
MGQQERRRDPDESERQASDGQASGGQAGGVKARRWLRGVAACALALTIGLGQAYADTIANAHDGGQGRDKYNNTAAASADAFAGDGRARASSFGFADAFGGVATQRAKVQAELNKVTVAVDVEEDGVGTNAWSRTVTRTYTSKRYVTSITNSMSYAVDEEGNRAIAKAMARARAPNNVAAVQRGAGKVVAKTSVDVTGNGTASADAGGQVGISGGRVKASTWGKTSAEVF